MQYGVSLDRTSLGVRIQLERESAQGRVLPTNVGKPAVQCEFLTSGRCRTLTGHRRRASPTAAMAELR